MNTLFECEVTAVKPLSAPTGLIFYQRFKYSENSGSAKQRQIEKDVERFYKPPLPAYRDIDESWYSYVSESP